MRTIPCRTVLGLAVLIIIPSNFETAQARPLYMKVFKEVHPNRNDDVTKCAICHVGTNKKNRNEYGRAVGEALGGKNVKDVETIKAALKKAEDKLPKPKK